MINFCHKFHDFHQMYIVYTTDSVAYKGEKVKKERRKKTVDKAVYSE